MKNDIKCGTALKQLEKMAANDELMETLSNSYGGSDIKSMFLDFIETLECYDPETIFEEDPYGVKS